MKSYKVCHTLAGITVVLGVLSIIGGIVLIVLGDGWIQDAVKKGCQLRKGTTVYDVWRNSPVPMYTHIYVFDIGSETGFLNSSDKPKLKQRGPYVYKEERTKEEVVTYPNETISYNETRSYTFQPQLSIGSENDTVKTINIVYMTLINYLRQKNVPNVVRKIIGDILPITEEDVLMNRTVKELLWGYKDPLLAKLVSFAAGFFTMDTVSIYNASVSNAGLNKFLINNGIDYDNVTNRIDELGHIEKFNFADSLDTWTDEYANAINGTDSTLWHPTVSRNETVYTFISDICRSVYLRFNKTRENQYDIDTYRFMLPDQVFSNSSENRGFCLFEPLINRTDCLPSGLFSLSNCVKFGGNSLSIKLPIIASSPHFLGADPAVRNAIDGLNPDDTAHRSFMDIEPITGLVMNGSRRLQINLNITNDSEIDAIKSIRPMVFPMIWIDEHAEIDSSHADKFRREVYLPMKLVNALKYALPSGGAFFIILIASIYGFRWYRRNQRDSAFLRADPNERTPLRL